MNYFKSNMRLLKKRNKILYRKVKAFHTSDKVVVDDSVVKDSVIAQIKDIDNDFEINIEKSRKNGYTLNIFKGDESVYLHSRYDPIKEAMKLVDNSNFQSTDQIMALGFGLGYHLLDLVKRDEFDRLFIIEPYMSIFYSAMLYNDLSSILKSSKLILIIEDKSDIFVNLRNYYLVSLINKIKFLENSASARLFNETYRELYRVIKDVIEFKNISIRTDIVRARQWRDNIILNLSHILRNPKADDFFNKFKGIPAVCVAAGPSLDKNIKQLKKVKGEALLMCVGTALKALLKQDIKPDIVVTMDGVDDLIYQQFEGAKGLDDSFLFAEKANAPSVNENWSGKQVFFTMKRNLSGWVESMRGNYTSISTGGSVAHSMVDLAYRFGADPIILVGQDLAYEGKKTHASGTMHEDKKVQEEEMYIVEGVYREKVYTSKGLKSFLTFFNNYFAKRSNRLYIDATEGGAKIDYTKIMSLKDAIDKYCKEEYNPLKKLKEIYMFEVGNLKDNFEEIIFELEETIEELENAIEDLESRLLKKIKKAEERILSADELKDQEISNIEEKLREYHNGLLNYKRMSYFTQRLLIIENLKFEEINNKDYLNRNQEFREKLKVYGGYWSKYLVELKQSLKLLLQTEENIKTSFNVTSVKSN